MVELPVECPTVFPSEVSLDPGTCIYTLSSFGPDDVEVNSGVTYFPHPYGSDYDVTTTPDELTCGTHTVTTVISDDELMKTCVSTVTVILGRASYA